MAPTTLFTSISGTSQGVKVGDYFRIFRYQGHRARDGLSDQSAHAFDVCMASERRPRNINGTTCRAK